jgi:hypothetical protein
MHSRNWPAKNPGTVETYEFDWGGYLAEGEAILASTAVPDTGSDVVVDQQALVPDTNVQAVKLSGGTARAVPHVVVLGITTDMGNTPKRRVRIRIRER